MEDFIMKAKMKKISTLFLSCILLFSITACQKKRTAKEVMQSSLKQSSSLKDADFNGNASYTIETGKDLSSKDELLVSYNVTYTKEGTYKNTATTQADKLRYQTSNTKKR